jgi:hypothetical protein
MANPFGNLADWEEEEIQFGLTHLHAARLVKELKTGHRVVVCWETMQSKERRRNKDQRAIPEIWIGVVETEMTHQAENRWRPAEIRYDIEPDRTIPLPNDDGLFFDIFPFRDVMTRPYPFAAYRETDLNDYLQRIWSDLQVQFLKERTAEQEAHQQAKNRLTMQEWQLRERQLVAEIERLKTQGQMQPLQQRQPQPAQLPQPVQQQVQQPLPQTIEVDNDIHQRLDFLTRRLAAMEGKEKKKEGPVFASPKGLGRYIPGTFPDAFETGDHVQLMVNDQVVNCIMKSPTEMRDVATGDTTVWPPDQSVRPFLQEYRVTSNPRVSATNILSWDVYLNAATPTALTELRVMLSEFYAVNSGNKAAEKRKALDAVLEWAELASTSPGWKGSLLATQGSNRLNDLARLHAFDSHLNVTRFDEILNKGKQQPDSLIDKALAGAGQYHAKKDQQQREKPTNGGRIVCYNCNKPGHRAKECRLPKRNDGKPADGAKHVASAPPTSTLPLNGQGGVPRN